MFYITLKSQIANSQIAKQQKHHPKIRTKNWFVANRDTLLCGLCVALICAAQIIATESARKVNKETRNSVKIVSVSK